MSAIIDNEINIAGQEVGYREGPRNNETKYGAEFGFNFVAWCAIFLSIIAKWAGVNYLGKPPRFASTVAWRNHAMQNGRWVTTPRVGSWAMRAHTSSTGHVGLVIGVGRDGTIYTREGNTNAEGAREGNGVWNRARRGYWHGYILPDELVNPTTPTPITTPVTTPNKCGDPAGHPLLRRGSVGRSVNHLQYLLQRTGSKIAGDGDFGPATENALRNFQTWAKITSDGVCGNQTWSTLHRHIDGLVI